MSIRVIGGELKGRRLEVADRPGLRPTTDRHRETMFNILSARMDFEGMRVVDLYAGSGGLGIESISRGATSCLFVERDRKAAATIAANIRRIGIEDRANVVIADAVAWLPRQTSSFGTFDLVLADPPYHATDFPALVASVAPLLGPDGFLLIEGPSGLKLQSDGDLVLLNSRDAGSTSLHLFCREVEETNEGDVPDEETGPAD